jgi:hypothetical protein
MKILKGGSLRKRKRFLVGFVQQYLKKLIVPEGKHRTVIAREILTTLSSSPQLSGGLPVASRRKYPRAGLQEREKEFRW